METLQYTFYTFQNKYPFKTQKHANDMMTIHDFAALNEIDEVIVCGMYVMKLIISKQKTKDFHLQQLLTDMI